MGAGNSKPEGSSRHVFASDTPVQFSQELVDSLQSSSETDSTRQKSFDLHVAERVREELEKISAREQTALEALTSKIAAASSSSLKSSSSTPSVSEPNLMSSPLASALTPSSSDEQKDKSDLSSSKVLTAIQKLRTDLEGRKQVKELSPEVAKAREEVVSCLRRNDRRPLDCWKEVEGFREAVAKLEGGWVESVL